MSQKLLAQFPCITVLVIGDLMLDECLWGHIQRISPEAPVPILNLTRRGYALGGAGNVVKNLRALGARVIVLGAVGKDGTAAEILKLLDDVGAGCEGVLRDPSRQSSRKTRFLSIEHGQQVFRMDQESTHAIEKEQEDALLERLEVALPGVDAILCSDYLKGVLTERLLQETFRLAKERNRSVTVAPKDANHKKYRGAGILVPNAVELARMAGANMEENGWLGRAAARLLDEAGTQALLVTRGREGMSLFEWMNGKVQQTDIPTMARNVYDVTGAGDTAVSVFTLAAAAGAERESAARLANMAAGIVVGKRGTASVTVEEMQERLREAESWPLGPDLASETSLRPFGLAAAAGGAETGTGAND